MNKANILAPRKCNHQAGKVPRKEESETAAMNNFLFWIAFVLVATLHPTNGWISAPACSIGLHAPETKIATAPTFRICTELSEAPKSHMDRRDVLATAFSAAASSTGVKHANALDTLGDNERQQYTLKFPTLFAPLYGESYRKTIKRPLTSNNETTNNIWALEQNLELGPLQTPLRCTVIRLQNGKLWVHAPLAPTQEFFDLVESCGSGDPSAVAHVVVPTYALEHKVFVKDALQRWPNAKLWTSPQQFSFPFAASEHFVFGKLVDGVLDSSASPPWSDEIDHATLEGGTFNIGGTPTTLCETAFFHKVSKSLIVTDAVAQIPTAVPALNDPEKLLLISKRSTSDPMPADTPQARLDGWEKTALLVSYFFPEHEEPDPDQLGVVTWTEGWHDNFKVLAGRLICPPVVRTLIYAQNPARVQSWVNRVSQWEFDQIVPAHFEAPIAAKPDDFRLAFRFLQDSSIDAFPKNDLARGLQPIADIALKKL